MRPQLIVDFSDRTLCALLVTAEGQLLPCSQEIRQTATRALSAEILFDPRLTEDPDFFWDEALSSLTTASPQNFFQRARRLGLRRPWDAQNPADALRLTSPLVALSSPAAQADPTGRSILLPVGGALFAALLEPVFSFLAQRNFIAAEVVVLGIVPSHIGALARGALRKVFRRAGFRQLSFIPRELAAAMSLLEEAPVECLVWDVTGDDLYLHRVALQGNGAERQLQTLAARSVRGLGWPFWVQQIGAALSEHGQLPDSPGGSMAALERALANLLYGSPDAPGLPNAPAVHLSHGALREALDTEWLGRIVTELHSRLEPQLADLDAPGSPAILLGAACSLEPLQDLFLSLSGGMQPAGVAELPPLERLTRGVATALLWRRVDPARRVTTPPCGSLRLATADGETQELLPAAQLPAPGEECSLHQHFDFAGEVKTTRPLSVHLLWGADISPAGNTSLCSLPIETGPTQRPLWLSLHLRRSERGQRLGGIVEVGFEGETVSRARASFAEDLAAFPPVAEV